MWPTIASSGPPRGSRHAHPRRAEHVARHLAERTRGVAPDGRSRALLARRPGGDEQALECLRERHARDDIARVSTTGVLPLTLDEMTSRSRTWWAWRSERCGSLR